MSKVTLKQRCLEGKIPIDEFIYFGAFAKTKKTSLLKVGDYLVSPSMSGTSLDIEEIAELNYLEQGDFRTVKGTTGPISGNVFIKIGKRDKSSLIEGDKPYRGPGSVYQSILIWNEMNKSVN